MCDRYGMVLGLLMGRRRLKMQREEYSVYAEELMKKWDAWRRTSDGISGASHYWHQFREIFNSLKEHGLLSDRLWANPGNFILRQAVHGSPILITVGGEIVFTSLDFARACHKFCKKYTHYDDVHILMVCAEDL